MTPVENAPLSWRTFKIAAGKSDFLSLFIVTICIYICAMSVIEISGRVATVQNLVLTMGDLDRRLAVAVASTAEDKANIEESRKAVQSQIRGIAALNAYGANDVCRTLRSVASGEIGFEDSCENEIGGLNKEAPRTPKLDKLTNHLYIISFDKLSFELLLIITAVSAAGIGGVIGGLRKDGKTTLRDLIFGLAAGFVIYLILKGGKTLFLVSFHEETTSLNPFTLATAGFIVGAFSERAYNLLTTLIALAEIRVEASSRREVSADDKRPSQ